MALPIVIFDGASISMKAVMNRKKSETRQVALGKAQAPRLAREQAVTASFYQCAIHISHKITRRFIKVLAAKNVQFIVAPYEANTQLAYTSQQGFIDTVIADDSDSLPYCCKHVVFKFDNDGSGQEVRLCNLTFNE